MDILVLLRQPLRQQDGPVELPAGPRIPVGMVCDGLERTPGDALPLADGGDRKQFHRFCDGFHHHEWLPASVSCSQAWLPR